MGKESSHKDSPLFQLNRFLNAAEKLKRGKGGLDKEDAIDNLLTVLRTVPASKDAVFEAIRLLFVHESKGTWMKQSASQKRKDKVRDQTAIFDPLGTFINAHESPGAYHRRSWKNIVVQSFILLGGVHLRGFVIWNIL